MLGLAGLDGWMNGVGNADKGRTYLVCIWSDRSGWTEEVLDLAEDDVSREAVAREPVLLDLGHGRRDGGGGYAGLRFMYGVIDQLGLSAQEVSRFSTYLAMTRRARSIIYAPAIKTPSSKQTGSRERGRDEKTVSMPDNT